MDYPKQVLKAAVIELENQIERDRKILKAYQQNVHKKEEDIFENNKKLEQLKRSMFHV